MATLNELAYNILNIARGGLSSDDDRLNIRQIKFWIKYYRAMVVKDSLTPKTRYDDVNKAVDPQLVQDMGVLELEEVDVADSPLVQYGCSIKRVEIPKIMDLPNNKGMVYAGSVDKTCTFIMSDANVVGLKQHQRFTGQMRRCFFIGEYLYVTDPFNEDLKYINVRAIFDDPALVVRTEADGTKVTYSSDDEYPIPVSMIAEITALIMQRELQMTIQGTNDEKNDSREPNTPINDSTQVE